MKKFFSLVLALVMALSLTTVAWGAEVSVTPADVNEKILAADAGTTIKLTASATPYEIEFRLSQVKDGITILGCDGAVVNNFTNTWNVHDNGGDDTVALTGPSGWTIKDVDFEGRGIYLTNADIEGWSILGCSFTNDANIIMQNAVGNPATKENLTVSGCYFNGPNTSNANYNSAILVHTVDGDTDISGNIFENVGYNAIQLTGTISGDVKICGNDIDTTGSAAIRLTAVEADSLAIQNNTVVGSTTAIKANSVADDVTLNIWNNDWDGGELLVAGVESAALADSTSGGATSATLYVWDNAGAEWDVDFIASGADLDDLAQDSSDNCLPCYLIDGEYFVETAEAAATYKLVYGAKTVYLAPVPASKVCYSDKASVLTVVAEDDAECGDYWVADATYDEDDVYYISYDKKGDIDGIWVKAKNGSEQILVNGKIVDAEVAGYVGFMFHEWAGHDIVNYQYTTVKCENCPKIAKLYANATAAGKKAQPVGNGIAGYITFADYMDFGANAPVVDTKVESAETFDAGIAMYVGMSIMAATGSAVVIGKKKD